MAGRPALRLHRRPSVAPVLPPPPQDPDPALGSLWPGLSPPTPTEQVGTSHQTPGRRWERPRLPEATPLRTERRPLRVTSELGRCPRRARPSLIRHSSSPFHNSPFHNAFRVKSRFLPSPARNPPSLPVGSPQLRRLEPAMTPNTFQDPPGAASGARSPIKLISG